MDTEISIRHKDDLERMLLYRCEKPVCLALSLLEDITEGFSDEQQIGSGGFAVVYKGIVGKGIVAVKKFYRTFDMDEMKFHKEVECLMKAKHKNIVHFLGYCSETHGRTADYDGKFVMADIRNWLLCFEYVPNGSLEKYISDASSGLEWGERYKIIKGICDGLLYLHENRILHLDLKPGNILINDHMEPKISDFGLSRCLDKDQTRAFTSNLCGSQGYLAPEFYRGQVAFGSDIYSLGVIMVEILTGEKGYPEEKNVVDNWMTRLEASDQWETQLEQVKVCAKIAIECMDLDPKKRPIARYIVDRLDKTASTIETGITGCARQSYTYRKGPWSAEEDLSLVGYISSHVVTSWNSLPAKAGLRRDGRSCRLRWMDHLRPDLKRGAFTPDEENLVIKHQAKLGNKWSLIAAQLPGRSANEVKYYWKTYLKKRVMQRGVSNLGKSPTQPELPTSMSTTPGGGGRSTAVSGRTAMSNDYSAVLIGGTGPATLQQHYANSLSALLEAEEEALLEAEEEQERMRVKLGLPNHAQLF